MQEDDRSCFDLLSLGDPGVAADSDETEIVDRLYGFLVRDQSGKAKEHRGCHASFDEFFFQSEGVFFEIIARREHKVLPKSCARVIGMAVGVVAPGDGELVCFFPYKKLSKSLWMAFDPFSCDEECDGYRLRKFLQHGRIQAPFKPLLGRGTKIRCDSGCRTGLCEAVILQGIRRPRGGNQKPAVSTGFILTGVPYGLDGCVDGGLKRFCVETQLHRLPCQQKGAQIDLGAIAEEIWSIVGDFCPKEQQLAYK